MGSYRAGHVGIEVDDRELLRHIDEVTQGAAEQFVRTASTILGAIRDDARARWPVGRRSAHDARPHSRDRFAVRVEAGGGRLSVALHNDARTAKGGVLYAYMIRFSRWSPSDMAAEAEAAGEAIDPLVARGRTPEARRKIARHFLWTTQRASLARGGDVRASVLRRLQQLHGAGAPADLAGKNAWQTLVRKPAALAEPVLVETLRDQIGKLARAAG